MVGQRPYGIQFLGDSLSLVMVTVASFVVTLIMSYGFGRGEDRVNRYYLPTFILFLTTGVIGSFLTSDLFNLYVMFEIMLLASFVLVTLGQSVEQLRSDHYLCCIEYRRIMVILARYWFIIQDGWNIKLLTSCFTLRSNP